MFVFRKIWRALFYETTVLRFALLPYYRRFIIINVRNMKNRQRGSGKLRLRKRLFYVNISSFLVFSIL